MIKPVIIAIDGYSSCGKSTLAKAVAQKLNFAYIDTGAMYRAVALYILRNNINWKELGEEETEKILNNIHISFHYNEAKEHSDTYLNGENVEEEIRGKVVSDSVSEISQIKAIRRRMVDLQQKAGTNKGLVMDGRDIGTKVFPEAELKIFMTAEPEIRARRRYEELKAKGIELSLAEIKENLQRRDYNDTHREENPLKKAEDAFVLDNTSLTKEEQLDWVIKKIKEIS